MTIPWAWGPDVFPMRHLRVDEDGQPRWWIWWAPGADGDFVRFAPDATWHNSGNRLAAATTLKLVVGDGTISADVVPPKLPPPATSGVQTVTLSPTPGNRTHCTGSTWPPQQHRIRTVKNNALTTAGPPGFKIALQLVTGAGETIGPIDINYGQGWQPPLPGLR